MKSLAGGSAIFAWVKRLLGGAPRSALPVLRASATRNLALLRFEPIADYTTFDLFDDGFDEEGPLPLRLPAWLRRLIGDDLGSRLPLLRLGSPSAGDREYGLPLSSQRSTEIELYRPQMQTWGVSAPSYVTWAGRCRSACNAEMVGSAPPRETPLRYFDAPSVLLPAMVDAWTERAWPLATAIEQTAHMKPIFVPERFQVGFCCGDPALAAEIIMLIVADNVEARLATAHDVDAGAQHDPCDVLLPVRPGASPEEVRDVIAATVRATHTVLSVAA